MARVDATGLKPAYSFDQLVIGPNNSVATAACREVIRAPGEVYNPLVIYGPAGVGKTHLMQAVAHEMLMKNPTFKVRYISAERFTNDIVTAIGEDRVVDIRRAYSSLDLLVMDDVQYLVESKIAQEELFHIFNNMHQENRQVILASDRMPSQLTTLSKAIRSRLEWGLATDIQAPDESMRLEILRRKQAQQGLALTDEMLAQAAHALRSNVRELEGFLKRVHAYVNLSHQELTMPLVHAIIRELAPDVLDFPANGATLSNESPGLSPAPGIAPDLTRVLASENGHKNGNGKASAPKRAEPPAETPPPPPPPPPPPAPPVVEKPFVEPDFQISPVVENKQDSFTPLPAFVPEFKAPEPMAPPPQPVAPPPPVVVQKPVEPVPQPVAPAPEPVAPPPPAAPPALQALPEMPEPSSGSEVPSDLPPGYKEVTAVFFFPDGKTEALETVEKRFQDVIRKHKLKFRLRRLQNEPYTFKGKIDYAHFADVCRMHKAPVAIVIGPPPESLLQEQDIHDRLTAALNPDGVSLQLVGWGEINKDYRYLNLALDIALVKAAR